MNALRMLVASFFHRPIVIVGCGQVGKSLLHKTLIRHPRVATLSGARESPYFGRLASVINDLEFSDRSAYLAGKLAMRKEQFFEAVRRLCFESAVGPHYGAGSLITALLKRGELPFGKTHWCLQAFPDEIAYRCILRLYPEARFIYLTRNGIGTVHDQMQKKIRKGVVPDFRAHMEAWAGSVDRYRYLGETRNTIHLSFEELTASPGNALDSVLRFLGLSRQPRVGAHLGELLSRPLPRDPAATARADADKTGSRMSRDELTFNAWPEEFRIEFRRRCLAGMEELGYEVPE